jgi:O-antigen/teichoic acid export membrane protein
MSTENAPHQAPKSGNFIFRTLRTASTRLLDLPSRYGLHLLIAARMPIDQVGAFYITFAVFTLASGFGRLGMDRTITKEVAASLGRDQVETARKTIRRGASQIILQSTVIALVLAALAKPIALYILHKPELTIPLVISAFIMIPQNIANAVAGALAGLHRVATSDMIYQWLWPGIFCIVGIVIPLNVTRALMLIFASMSVAAILGSIILWKVLPRKKPQTEPAVVPPLFHLSLSFFTLDLMQLAIGSAPSFALGIVASTTEVGRYALAWRIVLALNLLVAAIGSIVSPQFARAYAQQDWKSLRRTAANAVGLTLALSGLPMLLLVLNPALFLRPFGSAYLPAVPALRILLIGQAALILCTSVPELLGMTGHAKPLMRSNMISMTVLIIGLAILSPHFGDVGAAIATAITMIVNAVGVSMAARRDLKFVPLFEFYRTARERLRGELKPAVASDMPSSSDVQEMVNSVEASAEISRIS